jgi:hypothetical protein
MFGLSPRKAGHSKCIDADKPRSSIAWILVLATLACLAAIGWPQPGMALSNTPN